MMDDYFHFERVALWIADYSTAYMTKIERMRSTSR